MSGSKHWVASFPDLVEQWDYERNGGLSPYDLTAGSGRRVWWVCRRGPDHSWRAKPNNRSYGAGCPFCANRRVSVTNSLAALFPAVASEWDPDGNGKLTPANVVATSTRVGLWRCSRDARHVFRASIRDRTRALSACPFCTNHRAAESNNLLRLHPRVAAEWARELNGALTPEQVVPGARRQIFWRCGDCTHVWRASVANRVSRASGCPRCAQQRVAQRPQRSRET